jgi:hypothetical protein
MNPYHLSGVKQRLVDIRSAPGSLEGILNVPSSARHRALRTGRQQSIQYAESIRRRRAPARPGDAAVRPAYRIEPTPATEPLI